MVALLNSHLLHTPAAALADAICIHVIVQELQGAEQLTSQIQANMQQKQQQQPPVVVATGGTITTVSAVLQQLPAYERSSVQGSWVDLQQLQQLGTELCGAAAQHR
jgi:exopolyphosphatase/pppGpp-phosphohydrolase